MSVNCLEVMFWVAEVCVSLNSVDLSLDYESSQVNWVTIKGFTGKSTSSRQGHKYSAPVPIQEPASSHSTPLLR